MLPGQTIYGNADGWISLCDEVVGEPRDWIRQPPPAYVRVVISYSYLTSALALAWALGGRADVLGWMTDGGVRCQYKYSC